MREVVRTAVQFAIAQRPIAKHNRFSIRRPLNLPFKELVETHIVRKVARGVVPLNQHLVSFSIIKERLRFERIQRSRAIAASTRS